jgi:hypothetical protein
LFFTHVPLCLSNAYVQIVITEPTVLNLLNMARVQYGVIVTGLKGKIGGQVFQSGNVAKVLRNGGYRKGFTSNARQTQISQLNQVVSYWRLLSQADRELWNASAGNWPFKDKFGVTYYGSGYQKFVAYNLAELGLGFPMAAHPVAPFSCDNPGLFSVTDTTAVSISIGWANAPAIDQYLQIFSTDNLSAGRNANNPKVRYLGGYNMNGATNLNVASLFNAVYGDAQSGAVIHFKLQIRTEKFPIIQYPTAISIFPTP